MDQALYGERSRNPLARTVRLSEAGLRRGGRTTPLEELNLAAMADAFLRGAWLGGGGAERLLESLPQGAGAVPVTRATGTCRPVRTRQAAAFARALGELAVRRCGGPGQVAALAARAREEGVPLWIARRHAPGPAGPVTVAVDRRQVRADVWGPYAPAVRLRAPYGFLGNDGAGGTGLVLTVGTPSHSCRCARSSASPGARWRSVCPTGSGPCDVRTRRAPGCCAVRRGSPC